MIFALVFLFFVIFRIFYMTKTQRTALPIYTSHYHKLIAKTVHFSMYFSLSSIASTGLLIGYTFWLGLNDEFLMVFVIGIHEFFVSMTYWLISIVVVAVLSDGRSCCAEQCVVVV